LSYDTQFCEWELTHTKFNYHMCDNVVAWARHGLEKKLIKF